MYAKATAACFAAYGLSPIDLIPDFIPVLGYLDEVIILPLAIMLAVKMIPAEIMAEHRAAARAAETRPNSTAGAIASRGDLDCHYDASGWLVWRYFSN